MEKIDQADFEFVKKQTARIIDIRKRLEVGGKVTLTVKDSQTFHDIAQTLHSFSLYLLALKKSENLK